MSLSEMDLEEIEERHQQDRAWCGGCADTWPCDAATVMLALREREKEPTRLRVVTDEEPPNDRPMAPVAVALADALEVLGWDGANTIAGGEVRSAKGTLLGRLELHVLPYQCIIADGRVANVTAEDFIAGLRGSWTQKRVTAPDRVTSEPEAAVSRDEWRQRFRTPLPWESKGDGA